jgi:hypothetical protein
MTHVSAPIEAPNRTGTGWRKISDAMDCRATDLYTASFPGKAWSSRRHDGLRDMIYREAIRAGLLAHREYAPVVMRGLTDKQRKALDAASAAALHCEAGGAGPPREAVRVVDNVRTTRPDPLVHSREPGGTRVLIEVKSIAEVFAGVVPPPMQTQIQRMGGMSSAVIGGFCEQSPVVHHRQGNGEGARVTAQRGHITPEAWRGFHKRKTRACPTWTPAPSAHARFAT